MLRAGYGDVETAFALARGIVTLDLTDRQAQCRTDGDARRACPLRHCRGRAGIVWRSQGTAPQPRRVGAHVRPQHDGGTEGRQYRRRVLGRGGSPYPEDFLVCLAALRLGRPVKWIEDRREHLIAANHSREQHHHARAAFDAEGRILAVEDTFYLDQGAYVRTHGARVAEMTMAMVPGPYRVLDGSQHLPFPPHEQDAGNPSSPGSVRRTFVRERLIDAVADRLGSTRATVRHATSSPRPKCRFPGALRAGQRDRLRFRRLSAIAG